jgi:hypothetical protein
MSSCASGVVRSILFSSCCLVRISTFGLSIQYANEKSIFPFDFFLLSSDELEPQDTFFMFFEWKC